MKEPAKKISKNKFDQAKNLVYASYLFVVSSSLLAWNAVYKGNIEGFSLPSLLALLAFGFMWVHYLAGYLKANYNPELDTRQSTKLTQSFVLLAILAHPVAIVHKLNESGYGLPPSSFRNFFGSTGSLFVLLGSLSLVAFLAFEFKNILKKNPKVWDKVLKVNDLAMVLILFHGFKLGYIINSGWFRYVWLFYGLSILYFFYDTYIKKHKLKKLAELFIVTLVVIGLSFIALATSGDNRPTPQSTKTNNQSSSSSAGYITASELKKNNGLNNNPCWVAVSGEVYDASNNPEWQNGQHLPSMGMAKCGEDLTNIIGQSPHGDSVLNLLQKVGKYKG